MNNKFFKWFKIDINNYSNKIKLNKLRKSMILYG